MGMAHGQGVGGWCLGCSSHGGRWTRWCQGADRKEGAAARKMAPLQALSRCVDRSPSRGQLKRQESLTFLNQFPKRKQSIFIAPFKVMSAHFTEVWQCRKISIKERNITQVARQWCWEEVFSSLTSAPRAHGEPRGSSTTLPLNP